MKKTLFVALMGALVLGTVCADDSSTSTTTNSSTYNLGKLYGTQGENKCGTTNATGKGASNSGIGGAKANQKLQDCIKGYEDATKGNSSDNSNNGQ